MSGSPDVRLREALLVCLQMSASGNCQCSDDVPCEYETVPIGRWDVSAVTDMRELFKGTQFNTDISGWDTSSVNAMEGMFESTPFNQERQRLGHELGDVDEAHVLERAVQPSHRRLERVACDDHVEYTFSSSPFNQDIGDWDVTSVTDFGGMFASSTIFNKDIGDWDTSNAQTMDRDVLQGVYVQSRHRTLEHQLRDEHGAHVHAVVVARRPTFTGDGSSVFNQNLGSWDVSNVRDMSGMFAGANMFNGEIKSWDVEAVTSFREMFSGATSFNA